MEKKAWGESKRRNWDGDIHFKSRKKINDRRKRSKKNRIFSGALIRRLCNKV